MGGVLSLATSHHVGLHRLAPVLKSFTQRFPEVRLDIRFEDSEAAHDLVRHAHAELAVVTLDPQGPADLEYEELWDDPLWFVVLMAVVLQTSFLSPPFGPAAFYLKSVTPPDISLGEIFRSLLPFIALQILALAILIAFPGVTGR